MKFRNILVVSFFLLGITLIGYIFYDPYKKTNFVCPVIGQHLKLGKVEFPITSTSSPEARAHFLLGLRYLHNFMYPAALREFKLAKQIDPAFAMSYWGIAMSHHWSLWSYTDLAKGQKILYELDEKKNLSLTPLEKDLIAAVAFLYDQKSLLENDQNYMNAMKKLYQKYPDNPEIVSFYALSILGYASDAPFDKKNNEYLTQARAILKPFLKKYPQHPGITHYYIHATDIPNSLVPREGLAAIHNIYNYMSDSSHVMHMPSHLYTELGMWPEAIHSNQLSMEASQRLCQFFKSEKIHFDTPLTMCSSSKKKELKWTQKNWYACDADNLYHSAEWLQYEFLQTGEFNKAARIVDQMKQVVNIVDEPMYLFWWYRTQARQMIYTKHWVHISKLPDPIVEISADINWATYSECGLLLAYGLSAIHYHQVEFLPKIDERFRQILAILRPQNQGSFYDACLLMQKELLAAQAFYIENNFSRSIKILEEALSIEHKMQSTQQSLTLPFIPPQELYAEMLEIQKPSQYKTKVARLYQDELKFYPGRKPAMDGYETDRLG